VFLYVERSKEVSKLFTALSTAHAKFETPRKNRKGQYGEYADLVALQTATRVGLAGSGLFVCQTFHSQGEELILNTTLGHASGEYISSQVPIKQSLYPQHTTAYVSYMRRMAYSAILSLAADDDQDGESASAAATSAEVEGWDAQFKRALKSIQSAESVAAIDSLISKVRAKVVDKTMAPDSEVRLQSAINARKLELRKPGEGGASTGVTK
jgi:hypothetical protein